MRVLVVEDHPIYCEGVQSILTRLDDEDADLIRRALSSGALGFVAKSTNAEQLLDSIRRVLNADIAIPEPVNDRLDRAGRAARLDVPQRASRYGITPRRYRVLELMAAGLSNATRMRSGAVSPVISTAGMSSPNRSR